MSQIYAYYPGCSQTGTSVEYDASTRACCRELGVQLTDIPDWSCCGSTPAHCVDHALSAALGARNLVQAAKTGAAGVTTPCPSCLTSLKTAAERLHDRTMRDKVNALLDEPCENALEARSVVQILVEDVGTEAIKAKVVRPLKGLKVVPYYGCLMVRPPELMRFDDPENPTAMDDILKALGAEVVDFPFKTECCGASHGVPHRDTVDRLTGRILGMARDLGADIVAVACPLCQMNLDLRQGQIEKALNERFNLPVAYLTQLMGWAMGLPEADLGLKKLIVDPRPVLDRIADRLAAEAAPQAEPAPEGQAKGKE